MMSTSSASKTIPVCLALAMILLGTDSVIGQASPTVLPTASSATSSLSITPLAVPARFIPNLGQWDARVRFVIPGKRLSAWLERDALVLHKRDRETGHGAVVRLVIEGALADVVLRGGGLLPTKTHFFYGSNPAEWRTDVPSYSEVVYEGLQDGIDMLVRVVDGVLTYALRVEAGVAVDSLSFRVEGGDGMSLQADGVLRIDTELGALHHSGPTAWEENGDGSHHVVSVRPVLRGNGSFGFVVEDRDLSRPLVIDPGLDWATFLGGTGQDSLSSAHVAADGRVTVAGQTTSMDFPVTSGAYDTEAAGGGLFAADVLVSRFDPAGSVLEWSTFLGGEFDKNDFAKALHVLPSGEVIVGGWTGSMDYPVTPGAFMTTGFSGKFFVTRLASGGDALVYSAVWGPAFSDGGMAVDTDESVVVASKTEQSDFPTTSGAYSETKIASFPSTDLVVSRLSADGSTLLASTYFGASNGATFRSMTLRADGSVVVSGSTNSADFPVTPGAIDTTFPGGFMSCFDPMLGRLIFSTGLVGGSARALDALPNGSIALTGEGSFGMPVTPGAFQTVFAGTVDGFVQVFNAGGTALLASSLLGGGAADRGVAIVADSAGVITVVGPTGSTNFPKTAGAASSATSSGLFISRISPDATQLWYSAVIGGSGSRWSIQPTTGKVGLGIDDEGGAVFVSHILHEDFPVTAGAYDTTNAGALDGVVMRLDMFPTGAEKYGSSTPGCNGRLAIGVMAMPQLGSTDFGLTCNNADPFALGWLVVGLSGLAAPVTVKGAQLWVDPSPLLLLFPVQANDLGGMQFPAPLPSTPSLVGASAFLQFFWADACKPGGQLSASNALELIFQP